MLDITTPSHYFSVIPNERSEEGSRLLWAGSFAAFGSVGMTEKYLLGDKVLDCFGFGFASQ